MVNGSGSVAPLAGARAAGAAGTAAAAELQAATTKATTGSDRTARRRVMSSSSKASLRGSRDNASLSWTLGPRAAEHNSDDARLPGRYRSFQRRWGGTSALVLVVGGQGGPVGRFHAR